MSGPMFTEGWFLQHSINYAEVKQYYNELRGNSKHQKQIIKLQVLIREMAEIGSIEKVQELIKIQPIKCSGETTFVAHCRYLQYCISWLKNQDFVHLNEGGEE